MIVAVCALEMFSYELGMDVPLTIILPERRGVPHEPRKPAAYPVLYLLHGHGQNHTSWLRMSSIERYLLNTDAVVVMPNGARGCYVDGINTHRYGSFLTQELPLALENWFHITSDRENTFIAGLSMGGYGAFLAALIHPDRYAAAAALSPAIRIDQMDFSAEGRGGTDPAFEEIARNFRAVFGEPSTFEASGFSLKHAIMQPFSAAMKPRLLQLCGDRDPLLPMNRDFAEFISRNHPEVEFKFEIRPGAHDFEFWDREIRTALRFFGL